MTRIRLMLVLLGLLLCATCAKAQTNQVCTVGIQTGADFGAQVNQCIGSFGSTGGIADATGLTGTKYCSLANSPTGITMTPHTVLLLGAGLTVAGDCTITMDDASSIEGNGGTGTYADPPTNAGVIWNYPGTSNNFITLASGNNGWAIKLSNARFVGPLAQSITATAGHGLYASPGVCNTTVCYSNVGLTLDHVTFQGFYGDGVHLEDNVYYVDCFSCAAYQNGGYGWSQAPNVSSTAPSQVNLYSIKLNSNGLNGPSYSQLNAAGGTSAGELNIFGGTIAK